MVAMIFAVIISFSLAGYIRLSQSTLDLSYRSHYSASSLNLAEVGAEEALYCFNQLDTTTVAGAWSGWTLSGNTAKRTFSGYTPAPGATGEIKIYVQNYDGTASNPLIVVESTLTPLRGPPVARFLEITLRRRALNGFGIVGKSWVHLNSNSTTDSWSSDPDNNPATAAVAYSAAVRLDNGNIGVVSATAGALSLDSNASIYGTANTGGGAVSTNSNVRIYSATSPGTPKVDPSRVHTDFSFTFPPITVPAPVIVNAVNSSITGATTFPRTGDVMASDGKYYYRFSSTAVVNMDSNKALTINQPVVFLFTNHLGSIILKTSSNADINVASTASIDIYTNGNISLDSNNDINTTNPPFKCHIYGTSTTSQSFIMSSNVRLSACVYAPNASFNIDSNCNLYGSIVTNTVQMDSNAAFHYDESLANASSANIYGVAKWRELLTSADRAVYATALNF
jgi:hypothetical protein